MEKSISAKNRAAEQLKMDTCKDHPERQQLFYLEKMLDEAGYPYFFNFREDMQLSSACEENALESIDWDTYPFSIEVGQLAGYELVQISICFNHEGDRKLLELLDMRAAGDKENPTAEDGELYTDMTAEDCMEIIDRFFDAM